MYGCLRKPATLPNRLLALGTAIALIVVQLAIPPRAEASHLGSSTASAGSAPPLAITAIESFQPDLFTGRATTSIPIAIPPGRKGMQPDLALVYSSSGRNGPLGVGWSVDLGSIERSTKHGVPKYDTTDTFTFMFQGVASDLVQIPDGTYRAKHEGAFLRVESKGFDGWEVKDKSGARYLFGGTPDSEIRNASAQVFRWGLRKAIDPHGNYLEVIYTADQGQVYPAEIRYTGHEPTALLPPHRAVLTYESRPDVDRSLRAGTLITTAKRLKEIATYASGQLAHKVVLTYATSARTGRSLLSSVTQIGSDGLTALPPQTFTYQDQAPSYVWQSNTAASGAPNWNLRTRNFDVGPNNFGCLHPYAVLFNQPKLLNQSGSGSQGTVSWTIGTQGELTLRGSKDDHVHAWTYLYTAQAKTLSLSLGAIDAPTNACTWVEDATGLRQASAPSISLNAGWSILHVTDYHEQGSFSSQLTSPLRTLVDTMNPTLFSLPQLAGDVNEDGIADLIRFDTTKSPTEWRVALGTGIGFRPETVWLISPTGFGSSSRTPVLGDFNGGGKTDIAAVNPQTGHWQFGKSTGTAFTAWGFPSVTFAPGSIPFLGDVDGDGKTDLGGFMKDTGSWQVFLDPEIRRLQQQWLSGFGASQEPLSGDFNGDGLTDVAYVDASNVVSVALSTGKAFQPEPTAWHTSFPGRSTMTSADFNGDGLTDIAYYDAPTGQVVWAASDGSRFGAIQSLYNDFTIRTSDTVLQVADLNGDGLADPAVFQLATGSSELAFSNGAMPDLLAAVQNGMGGRTAISYTPSTAFDNTAEDDLSDLPFVVPVVTRLDVSDGLGNTYTTRYTYEGGKYEKDTKEFRGFRKIQVLDAEANVTETLFWQTEFKQGLAQSVEARDAAGNVMSRQENSWSATEIFPGVRFTKLTQADTFTYDGDATFKQTRTRFTMYDAFGNLAKVIEEGDVAVVGDERVTRTYFVYNDSAWIVDKPAQVKVKSGDELTTFNMRTFFYDGNPSYTWEPLTNQLIPQAPPTIGNLTKESEMLKDAADPITTLTYDAYGNVTSVTDALGRVTTNTYDATGTYLTQIKNALGHTRTLAYDARFGAVTSSIDPNGVKSLTAYDALGRVIQTSFIDPATLAEVITGKIEYDLSTVPARTTTTVYSDPAHLTPLTSHLFTDGLGRAIQVRAPAEDPAKQVVTGAVEFNSRGLVAKQWVPYLSNASTAYVPLSLEPEVASLAAVSYAYDAAGRLISTTDPDGSTTTTSYNDWAVTVTDANGHKTTRTSDAYGRLVKVEEFNGFDVYVTTYEYHPLDNLTKVTDAKGNVTTMVYDQLSRKLSMADPDMGTWTYTYDGVDNLKSQTDARGVKIGFTYDALNRLTKKTYTIPTGSGIPSPGSVTYAYDNTGKPFTKGRLTSVEDGSGKSTFEYDALGRLIKESKKLDGSSYTIQRVYDLLGRLTSLKYPDGETVVYTYNAQGGIERVASSKQTYVSNVDYNAAGQLTKLAYGNGVATDYSYNPQTLRLSSLLTRNASLATLQDFSYTVDPVGNVTQILDRVRTASQSFAYDDLNRLTYASGSYGTFTYQYDAIGNMISKEGINQFYGLPGGTKPHAITSTSDGKTFSYDANGNRISQAAPAGTTTSTYDAESRLKQVASPSGTTSFVYDGDGGRVKQTTSAGSTRYVGEVYEIAPNGTKTKYVFAGSLRLAAKDSTGALRFYHTDHLGSSNVITDKTGVIVEVAEYTPYGSLSRREGAANVPHKFTGQRLDASTGLYFYQARYYDPAVGRFISADPIVQDPADPQTLNRYSYVRNNPVNLVDPSGYGWFRNFIAAIVSIFVTIVTENPYAGAAAGALILGSDGSSGGGSGGGSGGSGRASRPAPTKSWALKESGSRFYRTPPTVRPVSESWTNFATDPAVSGTASFGAGFVPGVGEAQDFAGAAFGVDVITGEQLSLGQRALSGAALFVPFVGASTIRQGGRALNHVVRRGADTIPAGRRLSTIRVAGPNERFVRFESGDPRYTKVTPEGSLKPGTFAAPQSELPIKSDELATRFNLPNPEIPRTKIYGIQAPGDLVIGPRPVSGGPGTEALFPFGTRPGTVSEFGSLE